MFTGMVKRSGKKATTLSISLSRELARAVHRRVQSGLYTSANELIREALRLLLKAETGDPRPVDRDAATKPEHRLATAFDLAEIGAAMRAKKKRRRGVSSGAEPSPGRLESTVSPQDVGKGLRVAPERLKKLTLRE